MAGERLLLYETKEWLDRKECAAYLTALGIRVSVGRLANMASNRNKGRGPPFYKMAWTRVRYKPAEVAKWASERIERIP